jgi:hypothetical protein
MISAAIVINKNWEAEPMIAGMCSNESRPASLPFPEVLLSLQDKKFTTDQPRAIFRFRDGVGVDKPILFEVKVWCIQDLMDKAKNSSSSEEKYRVLPSMLSKEKPDLVIAAGTAGYISESSYAGSVLVGGRFFVHNGHPGNTLSDMKHAEFEKLLPMNINSMVFGIINPAFKQKTEFKFLKVPVNPAVRPALLASQFYTAIGSVNVTDYGEYSWVDQEAIQSFRSVEKKLPIGSLETTHGVIRLSTDRPCLFVSAIVDREGHFEMEVTPGQNYIGSFNAGIVLAQFISDLYDKLKDPNFKIAP